MKSDIDRAKVAAVVRHGAMIAQHEVAVRGHHDLRQRPLIGEDCWYVIFFECFAVYKDFASFDADLVARQRQSPA